MHEAASCDGICLDPSRPRTADQPEPTGDVEIGGGGGVEKSGEGQRRERGRAAAKNDIAPGLIGRVLAFFPPSLNETTAKQETQLHPQRNVSNRLRALSPRRLTPL